MNANTVALPLNKGYVTTLDRDDLDYIKGHDKWFVLKAAFGCGVYAATNTKRPNRKRILLHRLVARAPQGVLVDHIDGNTLNNCKHNLRFCTKKENSRNTNKNRSGRILFKGVSKRGESYIARIKADRTAQHLGTFKTAKEAAEAYDQAAVEMFGEFARTNKMLGLYTKGKLQNV